jgi:DNA-binding response OmpR family regulator
MTAHATAPLILVVDDDPDCRQIAALLLEQQGYRTCRAASGAECLDVVRREPVDLVLLDVMMPGMDGFEVAAALRADPATRPIPVILLTARDDVDTRLEGMYHGVSEYLTKPINRHELHARVRAQLHIRELSRQLEAVERRLERGGPATPPSGTGRG